MEHLKEGIFSAGFLSFDIIRLVSECIKRVKPISKTEFEHLFYLILQPEPFLVKRGNLISKGVRPQGFFLFSVFKI